MNVFFASTNEVPGEWATFSTSGDATLAQNNAGARHGLKGIRATRTTGSYAIVGWLSQPVDEVWGRWYFNVTCPTNDSLLHTLRFIGSGQDLRWAFPVRGNGAGGLEIYLRCVPAAGGIDEYPAIGSGWPIVAGRWYLVEVWCRVGPDGGAKMWIDGALALSHNAATWGTNPITGIKSNQGSAGPETMLLDTVLVADQRIGPMPAFGEIRV